MPVFPLWLWLSPCRFRPSHRLNFAAPAIRERRRLKGSTSYCRLHDPEANFLIPVLRSRGQGKREDRTSRNSSNCESTTCYQRKPALIHFGGPPDAPCVKNCRY